MSFYRISESMNINDIAKANYDWVEAMGWHNKTPLEALALIASGSRRSG